MFSGSYDPADAELLLKPVQLAPTPVEEKERLIQSGARHYSEMISPERLPSPEYLRVFHQAMERQCSRFAHDLRVLAALVARRTTESDPSPRPPPRSGEGEERQQPEWEPTTDRSLRSCLPLSASGRGLGGGVLQPGLAVVSLARAGTPVGVLLTRLLRAEHGCDARHYSLSIIRDRGIDEVALEHVLSRHPGQAVLFVDGWTGKGVIARELAQAVASFNRRRGTTLDAGLCAVADLCGHAVLAATADDYLIPSCILGATISGLVSRSILNADVVGPGDFHGCLFYREWAGHDLSRWFVDTVMAEANRQRLRVPTVEAAGVTGEQREESRRSNAAFVAALQKRHHVHNLHHVKPGIGEATRVLLRRVPERLLLRDRNDPEVAHLCVLAGEKRVPVEVEPALPYRAAALIKELD